MGPRSEQCLILAELHSVAVDFPKTGVPAEIPKTVRVPSDVGYPDFMEKKNKTEYKSQRVIGKLYRRILPAQYPTVPITFDPDLQIDGHEDYLEDALVAKKDYNFHVISLLNQFGIKTEAELVSGCIIKFGKHYLKKGAFENTQRVCHAIHSLKKETRKMFEAELEGTDPSELEEEKRKKASAWYVCTYREDYKRKEKERAGGLLGFPWVMVDVLVKIKTGKGGERKGRKG